MLAGADPALDGPVILFQDVVKVNFRGVTLHPSPERDVIDRNPAFGRL
jgi:hypothetical protein